MLRARVEDFFAPDELQPDGTVDERILRVRQRRVVGTIAVASIVLFIPSLVVAGVPAERWPAYIAAVVGTVAVISVSLLAVGLRTAIVHLLALADGVAISVLAVILAGHYHELALLYALVTAGQTAINGFRAAFVMVVSGAVLVPLFITAPAGISSTDFGYAFVYLLGVAGIPWIHARLKGRGAAALRAVAADYRGLVERVPAVVYTAEFGTNGAWRLVSPRIDEILGFPAGAWMEDPGLWWSRVHPDDRERVLADEDESAGLEPGVRTAVEYRMIHRDGRVRWIRDEAVVVAAGDGSPGHWSGFLVDVTDRKALEDQLQHQAFHDPLTGLANRALFLDRVSHALVRSSRSGSGLAVLFLDIDDFKTVNDGMGHDAGDALLVSIGDVIRTCLRPMDTAARLGGDEFAVLLEDLDGPQAAAGVAERLLDALARPFEIQGRQVMIGASIGIAGPAGGRTGPTAILRNADSAMYAAKRHGKGRYEAYRPEMHAVAVRRLEVTDEIRQGLERGEFSVHYQPVLRLRDRSIAGFEALVRWNHPRRGLVLPGEFVPVAEETGQIVPLGRIVLEAACGQARVWQDALPGLGLAMSVNVSARQFRDPSLGPSVRSALDRAGLDPSALVLEVTESIAMEDSEVAQARLQELKALGVRLAIDDFGTGYSSLAYLRRLPVDILKMDRSFVDGIAGGGEGYALASVIVQMGETLHLETVAEGVETAAQVAALRRMGCALAQGYYFARPMPAADVEPAMKGIGGVLAPTG